MNLLCSLVSACGLIKIIGLAMTAESVPQKPHYPHQSMGFLFFFFFFYPPFSSTAPPSMAPCWFTCSCGTCAVCVKHRTSGYWGAMTVVSHRKLGTETVEFPV